MHELVATITQDTTHQSNMSLGFRQGHASEHQSTS